MTSAPAVGRTVTLADVHAARDRIAPWTRRTPLLPWRTPDTLVKAECLQVSGSFKARGAFAATLLAAERGARGVLAWSSGNHGRATAAAARATGLTCVVLMPHDAPAVKTAAVAALGADVRHYDRRHDDREAIGQALAEQLALEVVPSSGHPDVIAGQATVCLEVLEQVPGPLGRLIVPVGGGGLLAGSAVVLRALSPATALVAVEPRASPDYYLSRVMQHRVAVSPGLSCADGLLVRSVSVPAYDHALGAVHQAVLCSEPALRRAIADAAAELHLVVEGAGAASLTQLFTAPPTGGASVAVASGGNIDPHVLARLLLDELTPAEPQEPAGQRPPPARPRPAAGPAAGRPAP